MKKSAVLSIAIIGLVIVAVAAAWVFLAPSAPHQPNMTGVDAAQAPVSNNAQETAITETAAPQADHAAAAQQVTAPDTAQEPTAQQTPAVQESVEETTEETVAEPEEVSLPAETQEEELSEEDKALAKQFEDSLSFPLTEAKLESFVRAALAVEDKNNKWDVQIASAETQEMAIEYNNFAVEEIDAMMKKFPGLTLDQYNELVLLSSKDPEFYRMYFVYRDFIKDEIAREKQEKREQREREKAAAEAQQQLVTDPAASSETTPASTQQDPDTNSTPQG